MKFKSFSRAGDKLVVTAPFSIKFTKNQAARILRLIQSSKPMKIT